MGLGVRDGAKAIISEVRPFPLGDSNRILMLGGITNACGSIIRLAVLSALRRHAPSLAPVARCTVRKLNCCGDPRARTGRKEVRAPVQCGHGSLAEKHAEQSDVQTHLLEPDERLASQWSTTRNR